MKNLQIMQRHNKNNDNFIYGNWMKEYLKCPAANGMTGTHFLNKPFMTLMIDNILERGAEVLFGYFEEGSLASFICYETFGNMLVLHYAYTKPIFRKMGVFTQLIETVYDLYPHLDPNERIILTHLGKDYIYQRQDGVVYLKKPYFNDFCYLPMKAFDLYK